VVQCWIAFVRVGVEVTEGKSVPSGKSRECGTDRMVVKTKGGRM
jgi:hypothetical protein